MKVKGLKFSILLLFFVVAFLFAQDTVSAQREGSVIAPGATVKMVQSGFIFTEGPAADAEGNAHVVGWTYHDTPRLLILKYDPAGDLIWERGGDEIEQSSARAIAVDSAGEVAVALDPRVGLVVDPEEGVDGVVVGGREGVLGGEAVLDGDDEGGDLGGHANAGGVEEGGGGAEEDETASVVAKDDGEARVVVVAGEVESEGGVVGWVEGDVLGEDWWVSFAGGGGGQSGNRTGEAGDGSVLVWYDAECFVWIHGGFFFFFFK